jgi:hypothetical protein
MPTASASSVIRASPTWSGKSAGLLGANVRRRSRRHMGNTVGEVDSGLAVVVIVVSLLGIVGALVAAVGSGRLYDEVGKGAFSLDRDETSGPAPDSPTGRAEAAAEIRQLVEAKSARREARGEPPLDVDAEVAALMAGPAAPADAALRDEVRQLVEARNERRIRRGQAPLDVDAEVERQLRDLGT